MLREQSKNSMSRKMIVKVLEELQAQAEVALCFVGVKHWSIYLVFLFFHQKICNIDAICEKISASEKKFF